MSKKINVFLRFQYNFAFYTSIWNGVKFGERNVLGGGEEGEQTYNTIFLRYFLFTISGKVIFYKILITSYIFHYFPNHMFWRLTWSLQFSSLYTTGKPRCLSKCQVISKPFYCMPSNLETVIPFILAVPMHIIIQRARINRSPCVFVQTLFRI